MFSKKPESEPRSSAAGGSSSSSTAGATFSVLSPDLAVQGDLIASADLHIDGKVEGNITCATLVQGETSEITGAVVADSARIAGRVIGSVTAGILMLSKTGRVEGDVTYDEAIMEQGAKVNGKFTHRVAELKLTLVAGSTEAS